MDGISVKVQLQGSFVCPDFLNPKGLKTEILFYNISGEMFGFLKKGQGLFLGNHIHPLIPIKDAVRGSVRAISDDESVGTALGLCLEGQSQIPVTDKKGRQFQGMIDSKTLLNFMGAGDIYHSLSKNRLERGKGAFNVMASKIMNRGYIHVDRNDTMSQVLSAFKNSGREALPVVSGVGFDGIVRESDIIRNLNQHTGVSVHELMTRKPSVARTDGSIFDVSRMLARGGYSRLPVVRDGFLVGMVSSVDILRYLHKNKRLTGLRRERNALEIAMNKRVYSIHPGSDVLKAALLMMEKNVSILPVVEDYRLVGVVTQRDILEAM
jgi:CBS domain-containing protein